MASLPQARQQSQRQSFREQTSSQHPSSPTHARPATSEDLQTVFVNDGPKVEQREDARCSSPRPADSDAFDSVKKCWICFADSTEDTPQTSPWRDPCPCALVAHEECLLDWIADMEAPRNSRSRSFASPKIECPQCKSEIKLARPRNWVVDIVRGLERVGSRAITPGAVAVLSGMLWNSSLAWGVNSIYAVFGAEDGYRILRPFHLNSLRPPVEAYLGSPRDAARSLVQSILTHAVHWRLYVGLPLITPILILSRTRWADSALPLLPILFFATQTPTPDDTTDLSQWPPSAGLAFAVLPYIRSAYNLYYENFWAEKERRWLREIQPRSGNIDSHNEAGDAALEEVMQDGEEDENVFEVRIDGGIWEEWEEDPGQPQPDAQQNRAAAPFQQPAPQQANEQAQPAPNIPGNRPQQGRQPQGQPIGQRQDNQQQIAGERRLSFSPTAIAETVLGAIFFPTIAGMSGDLLKLILPKSWTTAPVAYGMARPSVKGLLQEKWGRSLVGGCLFVVAKDAIMLYVRWKMAQMHRRRRVLDYDRTKRI